MRDVNVFISVSLEETVLWTWYSDAHRFGTAIMYGYEHDDLVGIGFDTPYAG